MGWHKQQLEEYRKQYRLDMEELIYTAEKGSTLDRIWNKSKSLPNNKTMRIFKIYTPDNFELENRKTYTEEEVIPAIERYINVHVGDTYKTRFFGEIPVENFQKYCRIIEWSHPRDIHNLFYQYQNVKLKYNKDLFEEFGLPFDINESCYIVNVSNEISIINGKLEIMYVVASDYQDRSYIVPEILIKKLSLRDKILNFFS